MIWNEFYLYVCSCIGWSCLAVVIDSEEVSILFTWRNRKSNGNSDGASSCGALNHRCFNYSCILITTENLKFYPMNFPAMIMVLQRIIFFMQLELWGHGGPQYLYLT